MSPDDHDLIARTLVDADQAAFGELVRRHQSRVRGFLRRLAHGDSALADDLAQEAFVEAHRHLVNYRGASTFSTWLLGIAYNRYRNHRRRADQRVEWVRADDELPAAPHPSAGSSADFRQDLQAALARLPADEQSAVHLCLVMGLSHGEAADVLSLPLGTLKTLVLRGKEKLRNYLQAWSSASPS